MGNYNYSEIWLKGGSPWPWWGVSRKDIDIIIINDNAFKAYINILVTILVMRLYGTCVIHFIEVNSTSVIISYSTSVIKFGCFILKQIVPLLSINCPWMINLIGWLILLLLIKLCCGCLFRNGVLMTGRKKNILGLKTYYIFLYLKLLHRNK